MGMFDTVACRYPLPRKVADADDFQTKDTPAQFLDHYEIREDGTLWHEAYDLQRTGGPSILDCHLERLNRRWEPVDFDGELAIYAFGEEPGDWIEFLFTFQNGRVRSVEDKSTIAAEREEGE